MQIDGEMKKKKKLRANIILRVHGWTWQINYHFAQRSAGRERERGRDQTMNKRNP